MKQLKETLYQKHTRERQKYKLRGGIEEEKALLNEIRKKRSKEAIDRLVIGNLGLADYVARRFFGDISKEYLLDLIDEGSFGLIKAAKGFNHKKTKGYGRFNTYAVPQIRSAIQNNIRPICGLGPNERNMRYKIDRIIENYYQKHEGRKPSIEEIALELNKTGSRKYSIEDSKKLVIFYKNFKFFSLYEPIKRDEKTAIMEFIPGDNGDNLESSLKNLSLRKFLNYFMNILKKEHPRKFKIINLYFFKNSTLEKIGEEMGITRERVRQLKDEGLRRIKGYIKREYPLESISLDCFL
jgi:RNA polymerase primary sigma factor